MKRSIIHWLYFGLMAMVTLVSCGKEEDPGNGGQGGQGGQGGNTTVKVTGVTVSPKTGELQPGGTLQLQATVTPDNATSKRVKWTSSNTAVATVDDKGLVTAVANGTATITATSTDASTSNPPSDNCAITVNSPQEGSHQGPVTDKDFGGNGSGGDTLDPGYKPDIDDDGPTKNGYSYTYGDHTVEVTDELLKKMSGVSDEGFSLPGDDNGNSSIWEGDIFVFPISELFPNGCAQKVTGKTTADGGKTWSYTTTEAALDEIFKDLNFSMSQFDFSPYVQGFYDEDGNEIEAEQTKAGFTLSIPEIFGASGLDLDFGDNVTVSPSMSVGFDISMGVSIVDYSLMSADAKLDVTAKLGADITIKGGKDKEWRSRMISVAVGAIPIGPIIITPEPFVQFVLKLSGEVNLTIGVNLEKSLKVRALYDGSEVKTRTGWAKVEDPKDPFSVTGNLSGGVEVGPDVGFALSIYKGALSLGLDLAPRLALSVTSSYPFTLETLKNYLGGSGGGEWLSDAFYEPSFKLGFGGHIQLAYKWFKKFEVPDNMTLSLSFGKMFFMPKLGKDLIIKANSGMAQVTTTIKNRALFDDNMYVKVYSGYNNKGELFGSFPFEIPVKPQKEDEEVDCTAYIQGLQEGSVYYVDGPFMEVGAFGLNVEVEMVPVQEHANRVIEFTDPNVVAAVKAILGDLLQSQTGEWAECNWDEDFDDLRRYINVDYGFGTFDGSRRYSISISMNPDWETNGVISVGNHSEAVKDKMLWHLESSNSSKCIEVRELKITDKTFYELNGFVPTRKVVINSPAFHGWRFSEPDDSNYEVYKDLDLDLSETGITILRLSVAFGAPVDFGALELRNCSKLKELEFRGKWDPAGYERPFENIKGIPPVPTPKSLIIENCPELQNVQFSLGRLETERLIELVKNLKIPEVKLYSCASSELYWPDCPCETLTIGGVYNKITISEANHLKSYNHNAAAQDLVIESCPVLKGGNSYYVIYNNVVIRDCPSIENLSLRLYAPNASVNVTNLANLRSISVISENDEYCSEDISLSDLPRLKNGTIRGKLGGIVPDAFQVAAAAKSAQLDYPHRYYYYYDWDDYGNYVCSGWTDNGYGFYYPEEPKQEYHRNPAKPNSAY